MVKKIMHDPLFLAQKSVDATEADKQIVTDLLDTLKANLEHCVGMAANMIGVKKNIIVVAAGPFQFAMINPVITKKSGAYQTEEGCLSLEGVRPCTRYQEIEVDYLDQNFKKQHGKYSGWTAQIIQHEVDLAMELSYKGIISFRSEKHYGKGDKKRLLSGPADKEKK